MRIAVFRGDADETWTKKVCTSDHWAHIMWPTASHPAPAPQRPAR